MEKNQICNDEINSVAFEKLYADSSKRRRGDEIGMTHHEGPLIKLDTNRGVNDGSIIWGEPMLTMCLMNRLIWN